MRAKPFFLNSYRYFIIVVFCLYPSLSHTETFTHNSSSGFSSGTFTATKMDDATSTYIVQSTNGTNGTFTSAVIDAGTSTAWSTFSWVPRRPLRKELPNSAGNEGSNYSTGNIDMTNNIVLFHLNETSGTSFTDNSRKAYNGSCTGSECPSLEQAGVLKTSVLFDGSDDQITVSDQSEFDGGAALTVAFWIKPTSLATNDGLVGYWNPTFNQTTNNSWAIRTDDSSSDELMVFIARGSDAGSNYCYTSDANLTTTAWFHVALVYDGSQADNTSRVKVYVNGTATSLTCVGTIPATMNASSQTLRIGNKIVSNRTNYDGLMDEFAIWNSALSATNVADLYKRGALTAKFRIHSCDDSACSGESYVGPGGLTTEYYEEVDTNGTGLPSFDISSVVASNRYFQYQLTEESLSTSFTPELTSVSITNGASPSLSVDDVTVDEAGTWATFTVSLSATAASTVTVDYATSNSTARNGFDYTSASDTLTFTSGELTKTFRVPITDDSTDENDETFTITLSNASNASISDSSGTGTITDNDSAPTVDFTASSQSAAESSSMTITAQLSAASALDVAVPYTFSGTATGSGSDYSATTSPITISAGSTTGTITLTVTDDAIDEDDETVIVTMGSPTNGSQGSTTTHTATVTDNDSPPSLSINDATVAESGTTASFTVTLAPASGKTVTVAYATANNSATAGSDYTSTSGTLTFTAGQTSKTVSVSISSDAIDEADETLTINLSSPGNASLSDDAGTGTIADDDPTPSVAFTASSQSAAESSSMTVTVQLSAASGLDVSVPYTLSGTATGSGTDYSVTTSPITISAGSTTGTITLTITDDSADEDDETVIVTMGSPTNASQGSTTTHTATITDNDISTITISAGADQTIVLGKAASLTCRASGGDSNYTYAWSSSGAGAFSDSSSASTSYTPANTNTDTLTCSVSDRTGNSGSDTLSIRVVNSSDANQRTVNEVPVATVGGTTYYASTNAQGLTEISIGSGTNATRITLPQGVTDGYNLIITVDGYLIISLPEQESNNGQVFISNSPISQLTGSIDVTDTSWFSTVASGGDDDRCGDFMIESDVNDDGVDDLLVSCPGAGQSGIVYIYSINSNDADLISTVFGSEDWPISSVLVCNFQSSTSEDLCFGPNNAAFRSSLGFQASFLQEDMADTSFLLSGGSNISGSIQLSNGVDGSIATSTKIQAIAFGDLNGDGNQDELITDNQGNAYIFFGPQSASSLSFSEADVTLSGGNFSEDCFGQIIAIGDVSGDGINDAIIGAPCYGSNSSGAVYVIFGATSWESSISLALSESDLDPLAQSSIVTTSSANVIIFVGEADNDSIGSDLSISDPDGNGISDIYTVTLDGTLLQLSLTASASSSTPTTLDNFRGGGGCSLTKKLTSLPVDQSYLLILGLIFQVFLSLSRYFAYDR